MQITNKTIPVFGYSSLNEMFAKYSLQTASGPPPLTVLKAKAAVPQSIVVYGNTDSALNGVGNVSENGIYNIPVTFRQNNSIRTFSIYSPIQLHKIGNSVDTLAIESESKTALLYSKYCKIQFDGTENWVLQYGINKNVYTLKINNAAYSNSSTVNSISNLLPVSERYSVEKGTNGFHINSVSILSIYTDNSSLSDFKSWLAKQAAAGNPFTIVYRLQSADTTDISDIQNWDVISKLFRGQNDISVSTEVVPSSIEMNYYRR